MKKIWIVIVLFSLASEVTAEPVTVTRDLPAQATQGSTVDVNLEVVKGENPPSGVIISEYIPIGWTLVSSTLAYSTFNSSTGEIKWVLFGSTFTSQTITYTLQVPSNATEIATFSGNYSYNVAPDTPVTFDIVGDTSLEIVVPTVTVTIDRNLPTTGMKGNEFTITLTITVDTHGLEVPNGLIIKEYIPLNWMVTSSDPGYSTFNPETGETVWLFYGGITNSTVSYMVQIPGTETVGANKTFSGEFLYTSQDVEYTLNITGDTVITVISVPGDMDGDNDVSDFELLYLINEWASGEVNDFDLLRAIDVWAS